jgi:hypothetical protein
MGIVDTITSFFSGTRSNSNMNTNSNPAAVNSTVRKNAQAREQQEANATSQPVGGARRTRKGRKGRKARKATRKSRA